MAKFNAINLLCIHQIYMVNASRPVIHLFMFEFRVKQFLKNVIIRFRFKDEPSKYLP